MILQQLLSTAIAVLLALLLAFGAGFVLFRGLILRRLTGRKYVPRHLLMYEGWGEIWAEIKARRLVAKLRRDGEL